MSVPTRARRRPNDGLPEQPAGTWAFTGLKDVARKLLLNEQASDDREGHLRAPEHL